MTGPVVLLLVAVMAVVALLCAGRLAVAATRMPVNDRAADVVHVAMGTAMVAMLLGFLSRGWDVVWVAGFGLAGLWFVRSGLVGLARTGWRDAFTGAGSRHRLQHGAGCLAMVAMLVAGSSSYAAVGAGGSRGMAGMAGMAGMGGMGSNASGAPGLAAGSGVLVGLAAVVLALGAVDLVQLSRGGVALIGGSGGGSGGSVSGSGSRPVLAPRCAAACRVAMSLTMGVALLAML
jgi:hypothetical protein